MPIIVRKTGNDSVKSLKLISTISESIKAPTITRAGAVAKDGTRPINGVKIRAAAKRIATTTAVNPVRPPSATPTALSK